MAKDDVVADANANGDGMDEQCCILLKEMNAVNSGTVKEPQDKISITSKTSTTHSCVIMVLLCYCQFTVGASGSLQAPFFPKKAEQKGMTSTVYGLVFGIFEVAVIVSSPIFGKLIPIGKPRFFINSGMFIVGVSTVLFGILDMCPKGLPFTSLSFVIRAMDGVGCASFMTACYTMVANRFPNCIAKCFSILQTAFGVGFIAGPTIGGILYENTGFMVPFFVMGSLILFGCVAGIFVIPGTGDTIKKEKLDWVKLACDIGLFLDSAAVMSATLLLGFNSATLEPHLRMFELSPSQVGLVFVIIGSVYGSTSPIWGFLANKKINLRMLCCFGYLCQCICLLLIGPLPEIPIKGTVWLVILSLVFGGLGVAIKMVSAFTSSLNDAIGLLGPTIGGALLQHLSYRKSTLAMFSIEVILMMTTAFYCFYIFIRKPKPLVK